MTLGDFEQLVLLAILHLGDDAYGSRIVETIEERSGGANSGAESLPPISSPSPGLRNVDHA